MDVEEADTTAAAADEKKPRDHHHHPLLPRDPAPGDLAMYENETDIRALISWLDESGQREGPLRAALLRAFPVPTRPAFLSSSTGSSGGDGVGFGSKSTAERNSTVADGTSSATADDFPSVRKDRAGVDTGNLSYMADDHRDIPSEVAAAGAGAGSDAVSGDGGLENGAETAAAPDGSGDSGPGIYQPEVEGKHGQAAAAVGEETPEKYKGGGTGGSKRRGRSGNAAGEPRATLALPRRSQELPRLLAEGAVELKMAVNPPGAHGNVMLPATEAVVEFDNDAEADEVRFCGFVRVGWDIFLM